MTKGRLEVWLGQQGDFRCVTLIIPTEGEDIQADISVPAARQLAAFLLETCDKIELSRSRDYIAPDRAVTTDKRGEVEYD